ncbi:hypothetical protein EAI_07652 [Harpegnathos saltator]|uniref:Uncharacterized protein n=1 Tax=Harpegnathos saltator TaxID=610380 RepID=E2B4Q1_HARSA|nr:hypothetical protein EAI_07652 [Harpegnathos saltator]
MNISSPLILPFPPNNSLSTLRQQATANSRERTHAGAAFHARSATYLVLGPVSVVVIGPRVLDDHVFGGGGTEGGAASETAGGLLRRGLLASYDDARADKSTVGLDGIKVSGSRGVEKPKRKKAQREQWTGSRSEGNYVGSKQRDNRIFIYRFVANLQSIVE